MAESRGGSKSSRAGAAKKTTARAKRVPKRVIGNRNNLDAALRGKQPVGNAAVLAELARTLADAIDSDVRPCEECRKVGSPPLAGLAAEYRRTLTDLAAELAEEGEGGERKATVLRLAGGMRS